MTTNKMLMRDMKTTKNIIHQTSAVKPETWNLKLGTALRHLLLLFLCGKMVNEAWAVMS